MTDDAKDQAPTSRTLPVQVVPLEESETIACLIVFSGTQPAVVFPLRNETSVLGRGFDVEVVIRDPSVSRRHAEIFLDAQKRCFLRDLGSTNGTFVNGRRVESAELGAGDRVQLGQATIMKLEYHGHLDEKFHQQLYDAGVRDAHTGLFNRAYFEQHLQRDLQSALRHKEELSLIVMKITKLTAHAEVDGAMAMAAVLRKFAATIAARVRKEDVVARLIDDELGFILRHTAHAGATHLADAIRQIAQTTVFFFRGKPIELTVVIGLAALEPGSALDMAAFLEKARAGCAPTPSDPHGI